MDKLLLNKKEAARLLGISERSFVTLLKTDNEIIFVRMKPNGHKYFRPEDLRQWVEKRAKQTMAVQGGVN